MDIKKQIYSHMLKTRNAKYKWFLRALRSYKYISLNFKGGKLLEHYYVLMRYIDDVVDGDINLPPGYKNCVEFLEEKIKFIKDLGNPKDYIDNLIIDCFQLARELDMDILYETTCILSSMLFDSKRRSQNKIFSQEELLNNFDLDIRGTVCGFMKVLKENPKKYTFIRPLGFASRTYYTLRDYDDDVISGFINIPLEDLTRFKISLSNIKNKKTPSIEEWFRFQAQVGLALLDEYDLIKNKVKLNWLTRLTLFVVFYRPAKKYFQTVLKKYHNPTFALF
jgi:hypothetical protein